MIELQVKRPELLALHSCIMIVVNNEIPSPSDAGLLLECLSDIAKQDKDTSKEFRLKLEDKQLIPCWHCCNIVLKNKLQRDHIHATEVMQVFMKLAEEIDIQTTMKKRPYIELV